MALSDPPFDLHQRRLRLISTPQQVVRLSKKEFRDPRFWSKLGKYRFDSPEAAYGVLYTAHNLKAAVVEVWGNRWFDTRQIAKGRIEEWNFYTLRIYPAANVANCTGDHLNRLGTDSNFFATTDYRISQKWGRELMIHPGNPEGIYYHSRKNPELFNYALFGRPETQEKVTIYQKMPLIDHPNLYETLDDLKVDLVE